MEARLTPKQENCRVRVAVFSTRPYDREYLSKAAGGQHELVFLEPRLALETAVLASGFDAVCAFVNDDLSAPVLERLRAEGMQRLALRSAGFNHVDLAAAKRLGFQVVHVPAYSPHAVAEHTIGLMLTLNRRITRASSRVREGNFALDGLLGFDMAGKTATVIGTGKIGAIVARILHGFDCRVLLHDRYPNEAVSSYGEYVELERVWRESDIITLHCPLTPETHHLIGSDVIGQLKPGMMLINTSRGALVDTRAVIEGLKQETIGYLGLDVYEEEADLFFEDHSAHVIHDDVFARLLTFPNVLITAHQAFFTKEALSEIARVTMQNLDEMERGEELTNLVPPLRS
jgi:D-lactate dehydrogenase